MPDHAHGALASTSLARHLVRGAIGFGLIGAALALTPSVGPAALLLAPAGLIALRGCPTCWIAGLLETISAGRLERTCTEDGCTLRTPDRSNVSADPTPCGAAREDATARPGRPLQRVGAGAANQAQRD